MSVRRKIVSIKNKILENYESLLEDRNYLSVDPIKFLPYRLTTLNNFIDIVEKSNNDYNLLQIFKVTEKIRLSLREERNMHKETLNELLSDISKYEYYIVSNNTQQARDILKTIETNILFYKQDIIQTSKESLLKNELQFDIEF